VNHEFPRVFINRLGNSFQELEPDLTLEGGVFDIVELLVSEEESPLLPETVVIDFLYFGRVNDSLSTV
jgi:hypothetical protein